MQLNNDDLYIAWLSGFWEGEGSVFYAQGCWRVTIAQKEQKVLQDIADRTNGKVYYQKSSNSYRVYWYGKKAKALLDLMYPHLRSDYRKAQIKRIEGLVGAPTPKAKL